MLTVVFCSLPALTQVANLACSISNNEEGVKLVRMSASQLETLCPQVRTGWGTELSLGKRGSWPAGTRSGLGALCGLAAELDFSLNMCRVRNAE